MSFRLKIGLGVLLIQIVLLVILVWSSLNFLRTSNEVEISNRAHSTGSLLASTLTDPVRTRDTEALRRHVNEVMAQPGIAYMRINGPDGLLLEAGAAEHLARPFDADFLVEDVDDGVFDVTYEIVQQGAVAGSVQLGVSTESIDRVMRAARHETATIAAIGMGMSLLFALMLGNYFARQLTGLRDATRRIASGDIGCQLAVAGSDELAQAANAFNTMSRKLATLYAEKQTALNGARQKSAELRESERRIQSVLDHALDAILTIDESGIIETFNPAAEGIFGYSADEAIGQSVNILMPEPHRSQHDDYMQAYMRTGEKHILGITREVVGRRKDGTVFPMELEVSDVQIRGRYLFVGIARDITERKRAEEELRRAKDTAVETARSKFETIANVSQEIRAPVNNMLSTVNALLETDLSQKQRECIADIHGSGDSLITIINDVLDFSKIEAGKLELQSIDFDLWRTVDVVYQRLKEPAARKKVDFLYIMPYSVPSLLRGDPTRLRQLLYNLIDNAIKYTDQGEIVLSVDVQEATDDHTLLRFEIRDTGVGIAPSTQKRIFEIFTHPEGPIARRYESSGLGLIIARHLAEMMGGEIGVESQVGEGSVFWFTARLDRTTGVQPGPVVSYEELENRRALIVNPSDTARASLQNIVNEAGMHSCVVENGSQALEELCSAAERGHPYDVVITDHLMPGMSGLQLARTIRSDDRISSAHMIMVAATGYRGDSEEVQNAGIQAYLKAPVEKEQLWRCIASVLRVGEQEGQVFVTRHSLAAAQEPYHRHVLVVSDRLDRQKKLLARLERLGYRASLAIDAEQAIDAAGRYRYEFLLVDNEGEELFGADALHQIRGREGEEQHTPVVVIVSSATSRDQQQAYRAAGADECLAGAQEIEQLSRQLH